MIRPLKFFRKIISVSKFWIMKMKRKIYFMMYHRKQTALFSPVIEKLLGAISLVLQMISTKKKKKKNRPALYLFFFFFVCFYSTIVPLNVFRVSSSWLSLLLLFSYSTTVFYNITNIILLNLEN